MKKTVIAIALFAIGSLTSGCNSNIIEDSEDNTTTDFTNTSPLTVMNQEGTKVYYEGSITVSGKYQEYTPDSFMGGTLCFYPDDTTKYLIPRSDEDRRKAWFCFEDQESAKELLGINDAEIFDDTTIECIEGLATIVVSDYTVDLLEAAVFDTANLGNIVSKEFYSTTCK
ncbi:MAG: hypothetical protein ACD_51C00226G0007 [uncultured bacterium]|nr:MAG: hypothetical protein ACD_51C00226G0007 [uncultured bacterium]OGJ48613.1 MAG: hypothetical protein A2344_04910 [Candidatus Peregrinibacteria bacterium RIFOXYB12_FULL_41_12]OGJ48704.1 MAG: hypothetical protein A2244_03335 [Candidatus Peregrinibacteria bacterium RIFOXYA2_FULL_41_18]